MFRPICSAMSGAILETWVIGEILKSYWHCGIREPFYYYRDKDKKEIDLLIIRDGVVHPLEVKKTASPSKEDVRHFSLLERLGMPVGNGALVCLVEESLPHNRTVQAIPVCAL